MNLPFDFRVPPVFTFSLFAILLVVGCSHPEQPESDTTDRFDSVADIAIEGMKCELSCAADVYRALDDLPGVGDIDIRFGIDEEYDRAIVAFDAAVIDRDQLVEAIHGLGNGVYNVKEVKLSSTSEPRGRQEVKPSRPGESSTTGYATPQVRYEMPNFLEVFTRLF